MGVAVGAGILGSVGLALLLLALITPRIELNGGLGNDGRYYAEITRAFRDRTLASVGPPFAYRLLPSALVALMPFDIPTGFTVLNLLAVEASALLIVALLRSYEVPARATLLAVSWWLALPMGARWALYDPVLPDALGFFLLMLLVIACLQRRYLLFAVALVAGVLTREHLLMTVPFMWRAHLPGRVVRVTLLTLIVSAPAAIAFLAVREFPAVSALEGGFPVTRGITNGIQLILDNWQGHAWRFAFAAPLSLGLLFWLPIVRYRSSLEFLGREVHWGYFLLFGLLFAAVGGADTDRYLYVLSPLALILTFAVAGNLWSSRLRSGLLTALHFMAIRLGMPIGPIGDPAGYAIEGMDLAWLATFVAFSAGAFGLAALVIRFRGKGHL